MTQPDASTIAVIFINVLGWVSSLLINYWRNSVLRYQHKAMWKQYAKEHNIPINGKE